MHAFCLAATICVAAGELLARELMQEMDLGTEHYMIWCVTPVNLALFLAWGYRVGPAVFVGNFLGFVIWFSPLASFVGALDSVIQVSLGTWLVRLLWPRSLPIVPSVRFLSSVLGLGVLFPVFLVSMPTVLVFGKEMPFASTYWGGYLEWCVSEVTATVVLLPVILLLVYSSLRAATKRPVQLAIAITIEIVLFVVFTLNDMHVGLVSVMTAESWIMVGTVAFIIVIRNGVGGIMLANIALSVASVSVQIYLANHPSAPVSHDFLVQFNVLICHLMGLTLIVAAGFYDFHALCEVTRDVTGKMLNIQIAERRRLSAELHDNAAQKFAAALLRVRMSVHNPAGSPAAENLQVAESALKSGLLDIRHIIAGLRPELLEQSQFLDIITATCEEFETRQHVDILINDTDYENPTLSIDKREHLLHILQEAIRNAIQHGQARTLTVTAQTDPKRECFTLKIEDDGSGFDPLLIHQDTTRPHFGISLMDERARTMGGTLLVQSKPGGPTLISVTVPLDG